MKICYIVDATSIHTQRWVNHFAEKGHEVHLISSKFPDGYEGYNKNIRMHHLIRVFPSIWGISGYLSGILWLWQIRQLVKKIKPDVVNAIFIMTTGYLGAISGFHPLVLTALGSDILVVPKKSRIHKFLIGHTLKRADRITCVSPSLQQEIIKYGVDLKKIIITPIGVDIDIFKPRKRSDELLQRLGISNAPVIISTRSLKSVYDIDTLIRAIPLVLQEIPQSKFIIVGEGEQRKHLETFARELGISDSIRFTGWIPHNNLPEYLSSSDVYISTSLSDGASVCLFEALACQVAPVVTDIPANREWVKEGKTGFLIDIGDHRMLADRIISILKNPELKKQFAEAGRNLVIEQTDHKVQMDKIEKIYEELIHKNK